MSIKISVIIPVYNSQKTIERAIDSVISQSFHNKEIIIINDGSTDQTVEKIEKYKESIKLISTEHLGVSNARNIGIRHSTGDYITFLDSDDYLLPGCLDVMADNIKNFDILCCSFVIKSNYKDYKYCLKITDMNKEQFIKGICKIGSNFDYMYVWGKLFKREVISEELFPLDIKIGEDVVALIKATLKSTKIKTINTTVYVYDRRESTTTKNTFSKNYTDLYKAWNMIKKEFEKSNTNYINYANINICRLDYTIITRLLLSEKEIRKENINLIIKAYERLKNNYKKLLSSEIVVSRKIMILIILFVADIYIILNK